MANEREFGNIGGGQGWGGIAWIRVDSPFVLSHEVGHSYGYLLDLYHDDDPADISTWDELFIREPGSAGIYEDYTFIPSWSVCTVMGGCGGSHFVHWQPHYQWLFTMLHLALPGEQATITQDNEASFVLTGLVDANGSISNLVSELMEGLKADPADESSEYALVFGVDGSILSTFPFTMGDGPFPPEEGDWPGETVFFHVVAPYHVGTNWVELRRNDQILARFAPSNHAPQVTVLSPNGGEAFGIGETIAVQWDSSDLDGDRLLHSIFYSPDGGENWNLVVSNIGGNEFPVDVYSLPGSTRLSGRFRVEVSDGFHKANDESDREFSVEGKSPRAAILSPETSNSQLQCGQILLGGAADDPEGALTQVQWLVDDADAGTGFEVLVGPLLPGQHTIQLSAVDADGAMAIDERQLIVEADTDCDGMSDAFEMQYGLRIGLADDAGWDNDDDDLSNLEENIYGTNPINPDTDGDGIPDGVEISTGSIPVNPLGPRKLFLPFNYQEQLWTGRAGTGILGKYGGISLEVIPPVEWRLITACYDRNLFSRFSFAAMPLSLSPGLRFLRCSS